MYDVNGDIEKFTEKARLSQARQEAGEPMKVFDWGKAVSIIKEKEIENANAGLQEDWFHTNACILKDSKINKGIQYLGSQWATPVLYDKDNDIYYPCWILSTETEWNALTLWPDEAIELFNNRT